MLEKEKQAKGSFYNLKYKPFTKGALLEIPELQPT